MNDQPPKIDNAPGLAWRKLSTGWEGRWRARGDLVKRGWQHKSLQLWRGPRPPDEAEAAYIADQCRFLQAEMLQWANEGGDEPVVFCGTLNSLIACYRTDPDSSYHDLRYRTRKNYDINLNRLDREKGGLPLEEIKARLLLRWHEEWTGGTKIELGHTMIGMIRTLCTFGKTILEDAECARIKGLLHDMRFPAGKPRKEALTAAQATAIREHARPVKRSVALAQAFQFECTLRQKDVIGEWVPINEPGVSEVSHGNEKWIRGLRWNEIDDNLILRHMTSKRQKEIEVDLKLAPMVMEELTLAYPGFTVGRRDLLPASGPIITNETNGLPYVAFTFRSNWRFHARAVGVPDEVFNMDSRAGAITEATDAGAEIEHVRHAAAHSNIAMTQRYSRGTSEKVAKVMTLRAAGRNKTEGQK